MNQKSGSSGQLPFRSLVGLKGGKGVSYFWSFISASQSVHKATFNAASPASGCPSFAKLIWLQPLTVQVPSLGMFGGSFSDQTDETDGFGGPAPGAMSISVGAPVDVAVEEEDWIE